MSIHNSGPPPLLTRVHEGQCAGEGMGSSKHSSVTNCIDSASVAALVNVGANVLDGRTDGRGRRLCQKMV